MAPTEVFQVEFVESVPDQLKEGTVYVSMRLATVIHLCACGCGTEMVPPLDPTDHKLIYDGDTISLCPSIGNWQYPCRSHYFIRRNLVVWADDMIDEEIAAGRQRSRRAKELAASRTAGVDAKPTDGSARPMTQRPGRLASVWSKLVDYVQSRISWRPRRKRRTIILNRREGKSPASMGPPCGTLDWPRDAT